MIASGDGKTIQWEADYFPFGAVRQVFKNIASNNYGFTGYEYDSDTGYNYAVARFDAGRWGRFMSPDPYMGSMNVTNPQSMNRYSYVQNNVINGIDPWGLASHGSVPDSGIGSGTEDFESEFCIAFGVGCQSGGGGTKSDGGGGGANGNSICSNANGKTIPVNSPSGQLRFQFDGKGNLIGFGLQLTGMNGYQGSGLGIPANTFVGATQLSPGDSSVRL